MILSVLIVYFTKKANSVLFYLHVNVLSKAPILYLKDLSFRPPRDTFLDTNTAIIYYYLSPINPNWPNNIPKYIIYIFIKYIVIVTNKIIN